MRTTVDLPEDLHRALRSVAHDRGQSLSQLVSILLRERLGGGADGLRYDGVDSSTGLPVVTGGRVITSDDVRALDDDA